MSLARVWRRQLIGASSAALIVPAAMFAALVVLALGGAFKSVGVLGEIFAGPPAPGVGTLGAGRGAAGGASAGGAAGAGATATALPVIPAVPLAVQRRRPAPGAINSSGGPVSVITRRSGGGSPRPAPPAPSHPVASAPAPAPSPAAPSPSPAPQPSPQPTVVDQVVKVVTSVTSQVPAPAGPAVTQAVQSAGSAADGLLPPSGSRLP